MLDKDYEARDEIVLCRGNIDCTGYKSPVVICVDKDFYCAMLFVYHEHCCRSEFWGNHRDENHIVYKEMPYENEHFQQAVVKLLIENDHLKDGKYELSRAELPLVDMFRTIDWKLFENFSVRNLGFDSIFNS